MKYQHIEYLNQNIETLFEHDILNQHLDKANCKEIKFRKQIKTVDASFALKAVRVI